jgi:PST family polysaccharide transporter
MVAIVSAFTDRSLSSAVVQIDNPTIDHYHTAWTLGLCRGLLVAGAFIAAAYPVADAFNEPRLAPVMMVLSISLLLSGLENPRAIMLTKDLVFWQQFMLEVSQKIVALAVTLAIAVFYQSYWALVAGLVASKVSGLLLSYTVLPFLPRLGFRHMRELFSFSGWITLGKIVNTLNWRLDHLLIGGGVGRAELGYYTMGDNLAVLPTREVMTPLQGVLFPALTLIKSDQAKFAAQYQRAQATITAIVLPLGMGMALVAEPLVRLALGEKWLPAVFVIQALGAVFAIQTVGSLAPAVAMAAGRTQLLFWRDLQNLTMRIPLIVAGLYIAGFEGVVLARVLSGTIGVAFNMNVIKSVTGLKWADQLLVNVRSLTAAVIMSTSVVVADSIGSWGTAWDELVIRLFLLIAVGAVVYGFALTAFWVLAGKPNGPETELWALLKAGPSKLRKGSRAT